MAIKLHASFAVHPGVWLRAEVVAPQGLSVTALAGKLHVTRQALSNLLGRARRAVGRNGGAVRKGF